MRKEITDLNNNLEETGNAISGTVISLVSLSTELAGFPWAVVRILTEETGGIVDDVI